ncbi:MAG: lipid-A-disaccharide synthase [Holosporales bacterium]
MTARKVTPLVYLVAGEASGDLLGGRLMAALKQQCPGIRFAGVGGTQMAAHGLCSLFPMEDLSIMGLVEILPHIPRILRRLNQTARDIQASQPDVVVTIDSPGFNFRLAKRVKRLGIPIVHYTAPSVWAWRPKRAKKVAKLVDHLLTLFPFEPPHFEREGLATTFVGHPLIETTLAEGDGSRFREKYDIGRYAPLLCVLPGSRQRELDALLPQIGGALKLLHEQLPGLHVVIPTLEHLSPQLEHVASTWSLPTTLVVSPEEKYEAMKAADAALCASGTVTLELALANLPMVLTYKTSAITAWIIRRMVKIPYVGLPNILLNREVVPELLQEKCTAENLAHEVRKLFTQEGHLRQTQELAKIPALLRHPAKKPSEVAAEVVLSKL